MGYRIERLPSINGMPYLQHLGLDGGRRGIDYHGTSSHTCGTNLCTSYMFLTNTSYFPVVFSRPFWPREEGSGGQFCPKVF